MGMVISSEVMSKVKYDCFYCRSNIQDKKEIESQLQFARDFFKYHNIENYKIYTDEGISGTTPLDKRPEALQLMSDIAAGKVKKLYVICISRIARATEVLFCFYDYLKKHQLPLFVVNDFNSVVDIKELYLGNNFIADIKDLIKMEEGENE